MPDRVVSRANSQPPNAPAIPWKSRPDADRAPATGIDPKIDSRISNCEMIAVEPPIANHTYGLPPFSAQSPAIENPIRRLIEKAISIMGRIPRSAVVM